MRPLREALADDPSCEFLLECLDGCREIDVQIYRSLLEEDACKTVDEIATAIDRDRSTAYRAIRRLHEGGYLERRQIIYDTGGYCYEFAPADPDEVARTLHQRLEECHRDMEALVEEFREECHERANGR